jgi:hypothetical protein
MPGTNCSTPAWRNFVPQPTLHVTCVCCPPSGCAALCSPRSIRGDRGEGCCPRIARRRRRHTNGIRMRCSECACDVARWHTTNSTGCIRRPKRLARSNCRESTYWSCAESGTLQRFKVCDQPRDYSCYLLDGSLYIMHATESVRSHFQRLGERGVSTDTPWMSVT